MSSSPVIACLRAEYSRDEAKTMYMRSNRASFTQLKKTSMYSMVKNRIHHICINLLVPSWKKINIGNPGIQVN